MTSEGSVSCEQDPAVIGRQQFIRRMLQGTRQTAGGDAIVILGCAPPTNKHIRDGNQFGVDALKTLAHISLLLSDGATCSVLSSGGKVSNPNGAELIHLLDKSRDYEVTGTPICLNSHAKQHQPHPSGTEAEGGEHLPKTRQRLLWDKAVRSGWGANGADMIRDLLWPDDGKLVHHAPDGDCLYGPSVFMPRPGRYHTLIYSAVVCWWWYLLLLSMYFCFSH